MTITKIFHLKQHPNILELGKEYVSWTAGKHSVKLRLCVDEVRYLFKLGNEEEEPWTKHIRITISDKRPKFYKEYKRLCFLYLSDGSPTGHENFRPSMVISYKKYRISLYTIVSNFLVKKFKFKIDIAKALWIKVEPARKVAEANSK